VNDFAGQQPIPTLPPERRGRDALEFALRPRPKEVTMITGVHALLYTEKADEVRAFFRDVLGMPSVDAGHGWLIFALPPAEVAMHPTNGGENQHQIYLMCDDVKATVAELTQKGVRFTRDIQDQGWGLVTAIELPGGDALGLYQPKHPMAIAMKK
jgi:predicted enzyme related to lactoylglutathione lyase